MCGVLAVQFVQFIHACAAAVQVHVMVTADGGEVGKVGDDRDLLAAEGQVDEILQLKKLQIVDHRLKLCGLARIEAVQPFGEVVQLLHIDREHFRALENGVEAVDLLHLAVRLDRVTDLQRLQQLHAVCVLVAGDGERDGRHTVFRVVGITENRLNHICFSFLFLPYPCADSLHPGASRQYRGRGKGIHGIARFRCKAPAPAAPARTPCRCACLHCV